MSRTRVTVSVDKAAIARLAALPAVTADVARRADAVLAEARAIAPVDTGEYRSRLHVQTERRPDGATRHLVGAGTDHDIYVEADHGTLIRALDAGRA